MVRTEVELTEEQAAKLEALARQRGISVSELIHEAVAKLIEPAGLLATDERRRRAAAASGSIRRRDVTDLAENHDKYLGEAFQP